MPQYYDQTKDIWVIIRNVFNYDVSSEIIKHLLVKCHTCHALKISYTNILHWHFCSMSCYNLVN